MVYDRNVVEFLWRKRSHSRSPTGTTFNRYGCIDHVQLEEQIGSGATCVLKGHFGLSNPDRILTQKPQISHGQKMYHVSRITYHVSRITYHVSRITYHVSRITYHVSRITYHVSRITYHVSRITYHVSRITYHVSRITYHASRITYHASRITHHASRFPHHSCKKAGKLHKSVDERSGIFKRKGAEERKLKGKIGDLIIDDSTLQGRDDKNKNEISVSEGSASPTMGTNLEHFKRFYAQNPL